MKRFSLFIGLGLIACAKTGAGPARSPGGAASLSGMSLLFAPAGALAGDPNIFEITVSPSFAPASLIRRSGDLPKSGQTLTISGLPTDPAATITAALYKTRLDPAAITHTCRSDAPVALTAGQTASVALSCVPVTSAAGAAPVQVFLQVAKASLTLGEQDPAALIATRDLTRPALFAAADKDGRRVTLKQDSAGLTVYVAGDLGYFAPASTDGQSLLARLLAGQTIALNPIGGHWQQAIPSAANLTMTAKPQLFEAGYLSGLGLVLTLELDTANAGSGFKGALIEEPAGSEFTVVSYNVENLFDQTDDDRNSTYGDYRIKTNAAGQYSNYGEPVEFEGQTTTFTDVKLTGIRRALLGIDPTGPEVVGLVEVESPAVLQALFEKVKDLGYQTVQFSQWPAGMQPTAVGVGLLSKFPLKSWSVLQPVMPPAVPGQSAPEPPRPILKATLDARGHDLVVYVNHWKSQSGPESQRMAYAQAVESDVEAMLAVNPKADYIVLGDLNSAYNEKVIIQPATDDANGQTGVNTVLRAQGDELKVAKGNDPTLKYDLLYEVDRSARRTHYDSFYGWACFDHMIVGSGIYDQLGITYVDNSFQVANVNMPRLSFLFNEDGTTKRWNETKVSGLYTEHAVGGFSDHAPIFARFRIAPVPDSYAIWLANPSRPDQTD